MSTSAGRSRPWWRLILVVAMIASLAVPGVAEDDTSEFVVTPLGDDVVVLIGDPGDALGLQATDPLGLVVGVDTLRDHSLGSDVFEVWSCGSSDSAASLAAQMDANVTPWFSYHSRGRYQPDFVAGFTGSSQECDSRSVDTVGADVNGLLHITPYSGGFATPGWVCGFSPCSNSETVREGNNRFGFIGSNSGFYATAVHEIGHMIQWPHSYTGNSPEDDFFREYDIASDIMSGNYGTWGNSYGSYPDPYSSSVINFYAAGWIDPGEVYVYSGDGAGFDLGTMGSSTGYRMAVIQAGSSYFTLAARAPSPYDPMPTHWSGVEVYEVTRCTGSELDCLFEDDKLPGFRRIKSSPSVPFDVQNYPAEYDQGLPNVIGPGESRTVAGVEVGVGTLSGQVFEVSIGPDPTPIPDPPGTATFTDTSGSVFGADIEWLADSGITKGCNPPANDLFCPDDPVTRAQMAAFLHRALPDLASSGTGTDFSDDDGSVFEADIEWLSATGVTKGCNPPGNDLFCPVDSVTRAQMAAFLHRALPDPALTDAPIDFVDDDGSVFEADIEWLSATGVTKGCNPPVNDQFCPEAPVTRGAMAAFLHRALGG